MGQKISRDGLVIEKCIKRFHLILRERCCHRFEVSVVNFTRNGWHCVLNFTVFLYSFSAVSTRLVAGIWWFFTLIMVSSYTANLAAFLTVESVSEPFKNVEELVNQNVIAYGLKKRGSTEEYFKVRFFCGSIKQCSSKVFNIIRTTPLPNKVWWYDELHNYAWYWKEKCSVTRTIITLLVKLVCYLSGKLEAPGFRKCGDPSVLIIFTNYSFYLRTYGLQANTFIHEKINIYVLTRLRK